MLYENTRIIPTVENIKIRDFRIIKKADITLKRGLNVIKGKNASGKTALLDYLASRYDAKTIESFSKGELNTLMCVGIAGFFQNNCFLIDDLGMLDKKHMNLVLKSFSESKNQIIVAMPSSVDTKGIKANVVDTGKFILAF